MRVQKNGQFCYGLKSGVSTTRVFKSGSHVPQFPQTLPAGSVEVAPDVAPDDTASMCRKIFVYATILAISAVFDVYFTWLAWPWEEALPDVHGGGVCESNWDCGFHGFCEELREPPGVEQFKDTDGARPLIGHCECAPHFTGSHCSIHIVLLELSLRMEDTARKFSDDGEGEIARKVHVDSISLESRTHELKDRLVARHLFLIVIITAFILLFGFTGLNAVMRAGPTWILLSILHCNWSSTLLYSSSMAVTGADTQVRVTL